MGDSASSAIRWSVAIELHASAADADTVSWKHVRTLATTAEALGFDAIVLPDHLSYRAGGPGDYARPDAAVGVRESMTVAAAIAAVTTRIGIAHSVVNAPYRSPAMLAHLAASLAEISDGRYELGVGSGNSVDYDQLGVDHDRRASRLEEYVPIVAGMLRDGHASDSGEFWRAQDAELVLAPRSSLPLVIAAAGPEPCAWLRVGATGGTGSSPPIRTPPARGCCSPWWTTRAPRSIGTRARSAAPSTSSSTRSTSGAPARAAGTR